VPVPSRDRQLGPDAIAAWRSSELATRLAGDPDDMLEDAFELRVPAGRLFHRVDGPPAFTLGVVVSGLARVYAMSSEGRQATIRYITAADVFGLPFVLAPELFGEGSLVWRVQALTDCHIVQLSPSRFRKVVARDAANIWPLCTEMARTMMGTYDMLTENLFQPVRARVARHMLDLAERDAGQLVVTASQQDIADAIGSVREVVSRAILWLRDEGFIRRSGRVYVLDDPAGLHAMTQVNL
jgi:CRP/FNR family transcriptional regulator, cyclic AMP receptor protein